MQVEPNHADAEPRAPARATQEALPQPWQPPRPADAAEEGEAKRLVLFDGLCNFCNGAVLFIVDRDPRERFMFASLQSDVGQATLQAHGCKRDIESVVLIEGGRAFTCSTAALRIAKSLKWPWPIFFYLFVLVPRFIRDAAYRYFGRHRYQWFGKSDQCRIPTPELRRRLVT